MFISRAIQLAQMPELKDLQFLQLAPETRRVIRSCGFDLLFEMVYLALGAEDSGLKFLAHHDHSPYIMYHLS